MNENENIIGREAEQALFQEVLTTNRAELISVIGRRRVGKTFLIRSLFKEYICFELAGVQNADRLEQLENFSLRLNRTARPLSLAFDVPKSWLAAFYQLMDYLEAIKTDKKKVVFWMNYLGLIRQNQVF